MKELFPPYEGWELSDAEAQLRKIYEKQEALDE
jgi:hypothetical protein